MIDGIISIYTDGSCDNVSSKKGACAYVVIEKNNMIDSGIKGYLYTTNNRMEMRAIILALEYCIKNNVTANIYTDSRYCVNGYNEWMHKWFGYSNTKFTRGKLLNADLWVKIYKLSQRTESHIMWVRGHNGTRWNEYADKLCDYQEFPVEYMVEDTNEGTMIANKENTVGEFDGISSLFDF